MPPAIGSAIAAGPAPRRTRRSPPPSPGGMAPSRNEGEHGLGPTIFCHSTDFSTVMLTKVLHKYLAVRVVRMRSTHNHAHQSQHFQVQVADSGLESLEDRNLQAHCAASATAGGTRQLERQCTALSLSLMPPPRPAGTRPCAVAKSMVTRCLAPGRSFARLHGGPGPPGVYAGASCVFARPRPLAHWHCGRGTLDSE